MSEKALFFSCSRSRWLKIDLCNFWPSKSFPVDAAVTRLHRSQWLCSSHTRLSSLSLPPSQCISQSPELFINDHLCIIKAQRNHSSDYHVCARGWGLGESSGPIRVVSYGGGPWARWKMRYKEWLLPYPGTSSIYLPITNTCPFTICWSINWMNEAWTDHLSSQWTHYWGSLLLYIHEWMGGRGHSQITLSITVIYL